MRVRHCPAACLVTPGVTCGGCVSSRVGGGGGGAPGCRVWVGAKGGSE